MLAQELLVLLRTFALQNRSATVDLHQFLAAMPKGQVQPAEVDAAVAELAEKSALVVSTEGGKPRQVSLSDFHVTALVDVYRQLSMDAIRPFPKEDTAPVPVPAGQLIKADVKSQLGALLDTSGPGMKGIVKLEFPEGVDSLIVPQECVGTELIDVAVAKISRHLQEGKNASYSESKLAGLMRGNAPLVHQSMEDVVTRPKKAANSVLSPSDFSFRFWTHLSNLILQDIRAKSEKTDLDHGACQAAYILGYTVFHRKGTVQREQEWAADRKNLEQQVRKPPFVFGFQDLYDLKDEKGVTYVKKHSQDFIHSFLKEKTKQVGEEPIPYLVRVHAAAQKKDYFLQRDFIVPVFLKKLGEASEEIRSAYVQEWTDEMRQDRTPGVSKSDSSFRRDTEIRVKQGYPLLAALSNGNLLFAAGAATKLSEAAKEELGKCFAVENILRPFDELLGLSRALLLKNARMYLPFWMTVPILSGVLRIFRRLSRGGKGERKVEPEKKPIAFRPAPTETAKVVQPAPVEAAKSTHTKGDLLRYRRSIQSLLVQYVPKGKSIEATLTELAEKWNPLYASVQKQNLVEDVNSLVRDFLRPVRRSFLARPPDLKRIHALAEQLSTSQSLAKIKKRDFLMRYIELYMVRCLQVKS
ncbi:MAG: hypothetical protein ABSB63_18730 [Spirochaetia bacterium]|jgi:hypothetical protein